MKSPSRRFEGFGVIAGRDGSLIWGTLRPAQADAWAAYLRNNPTVEGFPQPGQIVAVDMTIRTVDD